VTLEVEMLKMRMAGKCENKNAGVENTRMHGEVGLYRNFVFGSADI